jgi:hypothetical protein
MTIFQENRLTVSLKRFVQLELPKCRLVYYGNNKYYGNCRLLKHREVAGEGQSFLLDERTGRASCVGKCGFQGADINQIGAYLWDCTNTEAAQRIKAQAKKYGPPRIHNKRNKKKVHRLGLVGSAGALSARANRGPSTTTRDPSAWYSARNCARIALVAALSLQQHQEPTPGRCLADHRP